MTKQTLTVTGMKCANCKAKVEDALNSLAGVDSAVVSLEDANVTINYDETQVNTQEMKEAVDDLGRLEMIL